MKTPTEKKFFDHDDHTRRLEEAAKELRILGRDDLAGAVERARSLHSDWISRMAEGCRVRDRIMKAGEQMIQHARTLDQYVTGFRAPWIGSDLFPPGWPDKVQSKKENDL